MDQLNQSQESIIRPKGQHRREPSIATMERWVMDGVAKATDGCRVEPDGHCQHGKPSWLLELGYI
jgi:hypothetical protein